VATYRLRISLTYTTTANAATATTNVNNVLSGRTGPTIAERAVQNGSGVELLIEGLDEATAKSLVAALTPAWSAGARSAGKVSCVRRDG
jgi:hypothetical protein